MSNIVKLKENPCEKLKDQNFIGIDLGTTYTLVVKVDLDKFCEKVIKTKDFSKIEVKFLKFLQKSPLNTLPDQNSVFIASIVGVYEGRKYFGNPLYKLKGNPEFQLYKNIFYHWKLDFGIFNHPEYLNAIDEFLSSPRGVATEFLRFVKTNIEKIDSKYNNVIITVPASFHSNQRFDVFMAAQEVGFYVDDNTLLDEPNAAFIGFVNNLKEKDKAEFYKKDRNVLVFDFGGGTLDLSILQVGKSADAQSIEIANKALSRYNEFGGQDIDNIIVEKFFLESFLTSNNLTDISISDLSNIVIPQLASGAEKLKMELNKNLQSKLTFKENWSIDEIENFEKSITVNIKYNGTTIEFNMKLTINELYNVYEELLNFGYKFKFLPKELTSIKKAFEEILEKADLAKPDLDYIIMIGGSSKSEILRRLIQTYFDKSKVRIPKNPDKLVAEGAAIYSLLYHGLGYKLIKPIVADDIGVVTNRSEFIPLIKQGTELPFSSNYNYFQLPQNAVNYFVIPIAIKDKDYIIKKVKIPLNNKIIKSGNLDLKVSLDENKILRIDVFLDGAKIENIELDNPFIYGSISHQKAMFSEKLEELYKVRKSKQRNKEKRLIKEILSLCYDTNDYFNMTKYSEEYIRDFGEDPDVLNYNYIGNSHLGRKDIAKKSLERAIKLAPNETYLKFNYSVLLQETNGDEKALEYLQNLPENLKKTDLSLLLKEIILKKNLGYDVHSEAEAIVRKFESKPSLFSDFDKKNLLPKIYIFLGRSYNFKNEEDNDLNISLKNLPYNKF